MISSLVGANKDWESITDNLNNALSANSLVRQENVYKNLTELIKAGISENVEQRAFLETISDDLNLLLDTQTGSLARLIRLQDASIAENRVAIEYSLREFLNQNYQTSEYIKDSYLKVADSISELQAINTTSIASFNTCAWLIFCLTKFSGACPFLKPWTSTLLANLLKAFFEH